MFSAITPVVLCVPLVFSVSLSPGGISVLLPKEEEEEAACMGKGLPQQAAGEEEKENK